MENQNNAGADGNPHGNMGYMFPAGTQMNMPPIVQPAALQPPPPPPGNLHVSEGPSNQAIGSMAPPLVAPLTAPQFPLGVMMPTGARQPPSFAYQQAHQFVPISFPNETQQQQDNNDGSEKQKSHLDDFQQPNSMMFIPQQHFVYSSGGQQGVMIPATGDQFIPGQSFFVPNTAIRGPSGTAYVHATPGGYDYAQTSMPLYVQVAQAPQQNDYFNAVFETSKFDKDRKRAILGQPIRPLSAYNFFFSEERERFLWELEQEEGNECPPSLVPKDESFEDKKERLMNLHLNKDRMTRRRHRKTHGKVSFTDLSKIIGKRWRELPEEKKQIYRDISAADLERYQKALKAYNDSKLFKRARHN